MSDNLFERTVSLHKAGQPAAAVEGYRKLLETDPGHFDACHLLGVALHQLGDHKAAVASIRRAIGLNGAVAEAHFNLANALRQLGRLHESIDALQCALALKPAYPDARLNLAVTLNQTGNEAAAEQAYRDAIDLEPGFARAHNNLGSLMEKRGDFDVAVHHWRQAIEHDRDHAEAYRNLAQHDPARIADSDIPALERIAGDPSRPSRTRASASARARAHAGFALFEVCNSRQDYPAAFAHLEQANKLMSEIAPFNENAERNMVQLMKATFNADALAKPGPAGNQSGSPIFIVGLPRSGTSLVEQILTSHSMVSGGGELPYIGEIANRFLVANAGKLTWQWGEPQPDMASIGGHYIQRLRQLQPSTRHVTDKMPGNIYFLGLIRTIVPGAKIIHIRRDPVATCFACYNRSFDHGHGFSYSLERLAAYYRLYNDMMEHWHQSMPGAILDVAYEDLIADTERVSKTIIDHCRLEWQDTCLEFHKTKRTIKTASAAQVRRPIYTTSLERWKPYEKHLGPLLGLISSPGNE